MAKEPIPPPLINPIPPPRELPELINVYELPFTSRPQQLTVSLNGVRYRFRLTWNIPNNSWVMDISDLDAQPIINGIALVTGTDRLAQYEYLNFAGEMLVISDYQIDAVPTWDSLGASGHVYFVPNASRPEAEPIDPWNFVSPRYMIDAPSDGHLWGRRNSMWQRLVALAGDTMTGTLTLKPDANQPSDAMEATGAEYINIRDGGVFY